MPVEEAQFEDTPYGSHLASEGWFVLNLGDALALRNQEKGGAHYLLEGRDVHFRDIAVNVKVLWPGDPNGLYHSEDGQEGFLVLAGECVLVVEEQERALRQWDYVHCPAGTRHIFVGAGEGPSVILMFGLRPEEGLFYPASEVAAKYGASAAKETSDPDEAYADWPGEFEPVRLPWPVE
jgi:uncharacterized cupin superfamily protein